MSRENIEAGEKKYVLHAVISDSLLNKFFQ